MERLYKSLKGDIYVVKCDKGKIEMAGSEVEWLADIGTLIMGYINNSKMPTDIKYQMLLKVLLSAIEKT